MCVWCLFQHKDRAETKEDPKSQVRKRRFSSCNRHRGNSFLKDVMDARNLWEFVTSLNKYLEKKSFRVPLQTNHHRFSKSPELKRADTQDSTWQKYHIFSHCSYSSPILFFSTGLCCWHRCSVWHSSWSSNVFSPFLDFLQLPQLLMRFIVYPIGRDLVVSAVFDILLPDEAPTGDPALLGVLPTAENTLLLIFCQLPHSLGEVNLFSWVPQVHSIGPQPGMAKRVYASFPYCCFAHPGIGPDLSVMLHFRRQDAGLDGPTDFKAILIF